MKNKRSFTIIEIMVVLVIIGIMAIIVIPNFSKVKEDNLKKEAWGVLQLMSAAERTYNIETDDYYPSSGSESGIGSINQNLKLDLTETNWDYLCNDTGCVQATRGSTSYCLAIDDLDEDPTEGTCGVECQ